MEICLKKATYNANKEQKCFSKGMHIEIWSCV